MKAIPKTYWCGALTVLLVILSLPPMAERVKLPHLPKSNYQLPKAPPLTSLPPPMLASLTAYVIQINAPISITALHTAGFSAYAAPHQRAIWVGPELAWQTALQLKQQLQQQFAVAAEIIPYNPSSSSLESG